jgi:hypothetical protein
MTKQFRIEHNLETGEILEIELTADEIAQLANLSAEVENKLAIEAQKAIEKAQVLEQLGITADQAKLLLS